MPVTLNANSSTGFIATSDTSSILQLQTGGTTAVTVDASQNVGIGTASPAVKLQVASSTTNTTFKISNSTTGSAAGDGLDFIVDGTDTYIWQRENGPLLFGTNNAERMRIDSSGNVGIGTSSPGAKLDVVGSGNYDGVIRVRSTGTNTPSVNLGVDAVASADGFVGTVSSIPFHIRTNDLNRATITSGGEILFGKTAADVTGAGVYIEPTNINYGRINFIKATASGTSSTPAGAFYYNGTQIGTITCTSTATAYNTSSDYRLKENIVPMTGALAKVSQLNPVTYNWKSDGSASEGFIAHELQAVVPQCVAGEKDAVDAEGNPVYQGIDTSFLVATLTAAIQELKALVDTQASTITTLTDRITALENK